jgi:hypothetical protein
VQKFPCIEIRDKTGDLKLSLSNERRLWAFVERNFSTKKEKEPKRKKAGRPDGN